MIKKKEHKIKDLRDTPEWAEERRKKRILAIKSMSVEYQLGWYVGQEIARIHLPTLDVDMLHSERVIKVLPEEKAEAERLNSIWYEKSSKKEDTEKEWKDLRDYHKMLEDKYLPSTLECFVDPVNVNLEEYFKKGVASALWDCDYSHYKCSGPEDIEFELEEDAYFTKITLRR